MLRLLPDAVCCVDEREAADYLPIVGEKRLWVHPPTTSIGQVRDWIIQNADADSVFMVDDDLRWVLPMIGTRRKRITDPKELKVIAENGDQMLADLGLSLFSWCPFVNPMQLFPQNPMSVTSVAFSAFITRGKKFRFDHGLVHGEDIDFIMRILLHDRVSLGDWRFHWDCDEFAKGVGGMQAIRTDESIKVDTLRLRKRWGHYLDLGTSKFRNGKHDAITGIKIRVPRKLDRGEA